MKESVPELIESKNRPKDRESELDNNMKNKKEYELKISEDRFRRVFEHSSDPIFIYSFGQIEDVNPQACLLTGYSKEELLSMSLMDLHAEEEAEMVKEFINKRFGKEVLNHQQRYKRADGRMIEVDINSYAIDPEKGTRVAIVRDITAKKAADAALRASEERFRNLFEQSNDAVIIHHHGQIRDVNKKTSELTGYTRDQLLNMSIPELHQEEERDEIRKRIELLRQESTIFETQWKRADGKLIDVELSAGVIDEGKQLRQTVVRDITERKQDEKALKEAEEQFRRVFEQSSDPIFIYTRGRIEDVNEQACSLTGYSKEELASMTLLDLHSKEDQEEIREMVKRNYGVEALSHQKRYKRADGRLIEVDITSYAIDPEKGTRVAIVRDITAKKAEEEALRKAEERFRRIFEQSSVAIYTHKAGKIMHVNPKTCEMTGYSQDQLLTMSVEELYPEEMREEIRKRIKKNVGTQSDRFEAKWVRADGKMIDVEISTSIFDLEEVIRLGVSRDITERKLAEKALEKEKALLEQLFDNPHEGILRTDEKGTIMELNQTFTNMFGYDSKEVIGKNLIELLAPHEDFAELDRRAQGTRTGGQVQFEAKRRRKDGSLIDVLVAINPIILNDNTLDAWALYRDISEIKEAERRRNSLIEELEAKNAELERFTYTVSHDLKSPLITIKAFLGFIEKDAISGNIERLQKDIQRIEDAALKMEQLLSELLELSRIGRIINASEHISFKDIVREAIGSISGRIKERGVQVMIHEDLPSVFGDRIRLREVLENLLDNAVKFMGNQTEPQIHIESRKDGSETIFIVRDNGLGIKEEYHQRIFRLFERLDQSVEGTGVGLSLVKRIIEVHGGRIWIESAGEGNGTAVCFTLPLDGKET